MKRSRLLLLFCVLVLSVLVLSGFKNGPDAKYQKSPKHDLFKVVETDRGRVSGEVVTEEGHVIHIFRGIPYAAPPVGDLRWKPPQTANRWKGILDCTEWAPMAPQSPGVDDNERGGIDEDCLHLNIVTAAQKRSDRLPVMVFFHGGGLATHTGNSNTYNNTALAKKGVVTVTVNSRLGPLGYMAHPGLTEESEYGASGNYGTMDLVASLQWVRKNIKAFGGDPKNVTIFGESGGGTKTISVMTTPFGKGLFHKAIIESGDGAILPGRSSYLADSEAAGVSLQEQLGITGATNEEVLAAMRALTWEEIIEAGSAAGFSPGLTIDGFILPDTVNNIFTNGDQGEIPLIVGAQSGERMLRSSTPLIASLNSQSCPNTFVYVFSHLPPGWRDVCVAFHGLELPYVFGYIPEGLSEDIIQYLAPGGGCSPMEIEGDEVDDFVAEYCTSMWTQFAKTGNPSISGLIDWPAYTAENDTYLDIGATPVVKTVVADAYTPPPEPGVTYITTTTTIDNYGLTFTVTHPDNWVQGGALGPNVEWRIGRPSYYVPSLRVIIRPSSGETLEAAFTAQLWSDSYKTVDDFSEIGPAVQTGFTKAAVSYSVGSYVYDSMIVGHDDGSNWIFFEVYTVTTLAFDDENQPDLVLDSITFP